MLFLFTINIASRVIDPRLHLSLRQVQGDDHPGRWGVGGLLNSGKRCLWQECQVCCQVQGESKILEISISVKMWKEYLHKILLPILLLKYASLITLTLSARKAKQMQAELLLLCVHPHRQEL